MGPKFKMGDKAQITCSGEAGEVIGISEYKYHAQRSILLRYRGADGRAVEQWWSEDALEPAA